MSLCSSSLYTLKWISQFSLMIAGNTIWYCPRSLRKTVFWVSRYKFYQKIFNPVMEQKKTKIVIHWFRRDLRLEDNHGLLQALVSGIPVLPLFIFDINILSLLDDKYDRRVDYIHQALTILNAALGKEGSRLYTFYGSPREIFIQLTRAYDVQAVYCNRDYEPAAIRRDEAVKQLLQETQVDFYEYKDQVIFEQQEIVKEDGNPYSVFTPYSRKWKSRLQTQHYAPYERTTGRFLPARLEDILSLDAIGFQKTNEVFRIPVPDPVIISRYHAQRDYPAQDATTHLGVALRFGTISVRKCVQIAILYNEVWLNELIWREFFMQILYHYPKVVHYCFKEKYEAVPWRNEEAEFEKWCNGTTGYGIVDAGMRQLNATGRMHNRIRMITAGFLTKHLLIDWRWGEAYFAQKLLDYDLAANNGNWQWAAGCGCDAAPYFRVFNPDEQTRKFDKDLQYVSTWCREYTDGAILPPRIVEHTYARNRAIATYKKALEETL